jgi:quercetin dioxygenase-like cupin family protein
MNTAELKSFNKPDKVQEFPGVRVEVIEVGGATITRSTYKPGWRWSNSVQPFAKTKSHEAPHFEYHISGVLRIRLDDGTEFEVHPGDVIQVPAGHDGWVVGDVPVVTVDFQGLADHAKAK